MNQRESMSPDAAAFKRNGSCCHISSSIWVYMGGIPCTSEIEPELKGLKIKYLLFVMATGRRKHDLSSCVCELNLPLFLETLQGLNAAKCKTAAAGDTTFSKNLMTSLSGKKGKL